MPAFFDKVVTVYGRKPALEVLSDPDLTCYRLHLADSNRPAKILDELCSLAARRGIEIARHSKRELSRISRKGSQDQGVAVDVVCPRFRSLPEFLDEDTGAPSRLLAADGITNPQNAGMLIRSAVAGGVDGILWPSTGNAALGPLAVKASTGTLFRAPLVRCRDLAAALDACQRRGFQVCVLDAGAAEALPGAELPERAIYVLGNETDGPSPAVRTLADRALRISMQNGVESLNVAVTAALIAYLTA
jgi:23S rRNA (guanosine2251-2'-O)-methyltransferase